MNEMMDFGSGPGGPMISGKWINKKTGDIINVRDCFISEDSMVIMTDKGQLSMDEFSKYYIQASDEMYDSSGRVINTKPISPDEFPDLTYSNNENNTAVNFYSDTQIVAEFNNNNKLDKIKNKPILNNFELIDKIFKKTESKPNANLKIEWADFPHKELSMLVNYFDVNINDIAAYIGKYLINENLLNDALVDWLGKQGIN